MYNQPEWRDKRTGIRVARLSIEPLCRVCKCIGLTTVAVEVDHIVPHEGNWDLFVEIENTQSLCKMHHSRKTAGEVNGRKHRGK